ncbi:MAG: hypothetical protein ACFBSE_04395 [Prochloraceae cyanobacterium]
MNPQTREIERLEIRIQYTRQRIEQLRSQGKVAPPRTWIQKFVVPKKNGKKYYYYRLMEATNKKSPSGAIQGKLKLYLGNKHSSKYLSYKAAIERRNELQTLERRYSQLMALYEKLLNSPVSYGFEDKSVVETEGNKTETNSTIIQELVRSVAEIKEEMRRLWEYVGEIGQKLGVAVPVGGIG